MAKKDKIFEVTFGPFHLKFVNPPDWALVFILIAMLIPLCWVARWFLK